MRFDEAFAEGNGNGKVSRTELSGAGLILGIFGQTDFWQGFTIPPGAIPPVAPVPGGNNTIDVTPLAAKLLQQKLDQQLFSRYTVTSSSKLAADDLRLEWMQLAIRFFLADKIVHHYAPTDGKNPRASWIPRQRSAPWASGASRSTLITTSFFISTTRRPRAATVTDTTARSKPSTTSRTWSSRTSCGP